MAKKSKNVITITDILEKKGLQEDYSTYHSGLFGKDFEIETIGPDKIIDIMNNPESSEYEKYTQLIYLSCPIFRAKELHKDYEVENPYDIVDKVFNNQYAEIFEFGNLILRKYGFTSDRVEKVKKP